MKKITHDTLVTLRQVMRQPSSIGIIFAVALVIFTLAIALINHEFLGFLSHSEIFTGSQKVRLFALSFGSFLTALPLSSQIFLILIALLSGVNIAFLVLYMRRRIVKQRAGGVGTLGILGGMFGVGCGACGSVLLSSLVGVGAATQIIGFLPLHGIEFSLISVAILVGATMFLAKKIQDPEVCPIKLPK